MDISARMGSKCSKKRTWCQGYPRLKPPKRFVKIAWWKDNIVIHFLKQACGEPPTFFSWCMLIYVDQSIQFQMAKNNILLHSSMILTGKLGCTSWWRNQKLFPHSNLIKLELRRKLELTYGALKQTVRENLHHKISPTSTMSMVFIDSWRLPIHLNRTVS